MTNFERLRAMLEPKLGGWLSAAQIDDLVRYQLEQGVIVPPCKVGEVLHQFDPDGNFYQMNVTGLLIRTSDRPLVVMTDAVDFDADLIGTCFFTTKEQAENAYKERENR